MVVAAWSSVARRWQFPYTVPGSGTRDLFVLIALIVVGTAAWAVQTKNGFNGDEYVLRGFYNGDTVTFVSLVQRAIIDPTNLSRNPFAANGDLEYPTLLHAGFGTALRLMGTGVDWLRFLPLLTYLQLLITIPLFFLLWDVVLPQPPAGEQWLGVMNHWLILFSQTIITVGVLALAWDNSIFPQSHFFLSGLFILAGAALVQSNRVPSREQYVAAGVGVLISLLLMLANAVTGTAALLGVIAWTAARALLPSISVRLRLGLVLLVGILLAIFFAAIPGHAELGLPQFSYTATGDIVRLLPFLALLFAGALLQLNRASFLPLYSVGLGFLALIIFFLSTRSIVVANASRFLYHAILVASPLLLLPVLRLWYYLRREYWLSTRSFLEYVVAWGSTGILVTLLTFPMLSSVASAHDILMFSQPFSLSRAEQEALWWIADHSLPTDIILTSPLEPWVVPYFTGRSLLRAGHNDSEATPFWLSPDDAVLADQRVAFTGNKEAQTRILPEADYLLLDTAALPQWEPLPARQVFRNQASTVFKLR